MQAGFAPQRRFSERIAPFPNWFVADRNSGIGRNANPGSGSDCETRANDHSDTQTAKSPLSWFSRDIRKPEHYRDAENNWYRKTGFGRRTAADSDIRAFP